jgi:D-alanine--poly(phosphoribitol) ligase subunit 1
VNLLGRIDHWAVAAPDAIAHISGDRKLTFGQLAARADSLAATILERCGGERSPVAVVGHREPEMLIAFIGAVKSGRPYIPIDTAFPRERISHFLTNAKPALVLTPEETAELSEPAKSSPPLPLQTDDPF